MDEITSIFIEFSISVGPVREERGLDADQNRALEAMCDREDGCSDRGSIQASGRQAIGCVDRFWEELGIRGAHTGQEGDL